MAKREYPNKIAAQTQRLMQAEVEETEYFSSTDENDQNKSEFIENSSEIDMPVPKEEESDTIDVNINPEVASFIKNKGEGRRKSGKGNRCFYISNSNFEKLKRLGEQNGMSTSEVLDSILAEYI